MADLDPDLLFETLNALADAAGALSLAQFRVPMAVENKAASGFDPVTEADRAAERAIRTEIEKRFPDHGILGEEYGASGGPSPHRWVIDPIDGTRAYICGAPSWTTLVALETEGRPVAGLIAQPFLEERWIGVAGAGCRYERGTDILPATTSGCTSLPDARVMVTDARGQGAYFTPEEGVAVAALCAQTKTLRQGLDGYGFGLLASGHLDLVIEAGLSWYDIAGPLGVVEAAGGVVMGWDGARLREGFSRGRVIAAASRELADAAAEVLAKTV